MAEVRSEDVVFPRAADMLRGVLVRPDRTGPHPGLILVPDVRGVSPHYREVAARFAAAGFTTLVSDLYSREGVPELPDMPAVFRWMRQLPDGRVLGDLQAAVDYLATQSDVRPTAIGITGYCMGGQYALMAACRVRGLAACVTWYGMLRYAELDERKPESPLAMAKDVACPFLGLFGREDPLVPLDDVDELRATLARAGKVFEIVTYPDAGHAFFNDTRPDAYRPLAAADAWPRALTFLHRHLGGDA